MKRFLSSVLLLLVSSSMWAQKSSLKEYGNTVRLEVDGTPFIVLGGELGNSSAACADDIEANFAKLERMGLNTVLVPAYWDMTEPQEGVFDFSLTDKVLEEARVRNLKVIFLWFGAWKNSMSCYAPLWFKSDSRRFPRARTADGKPLEIASAFSEEVFKADNKAFRAWLTHIAEMDKAHGTVIMVQIENEIGMLEDARDHSVTADRHFNAKVPRQLTEYLSAHKDILHPYMLEKWSSAGCRMEGTWTELFGEDIYTDEIFMAWFYASYVERMAKSAREIYDIPLFVNAAMNSRGRRPGEYPSAGPLAHLKDIWHAAAPSVDFLSPDIYDDGFKDWVAKYHLPDNPLFIPETKMTQDNGVRAFYVFGEHDAIGISPFAIEDASDAQGTPFVEGYGKLRELLPLITKWQGQDAMWGLLFDQTDRERVITDGDLVLTCRHNFTLPWDPRATDGTTWPEGGGIIIRLAEDEYLIAGNGIVVEFATAQEKAGQNQISLGEDGFVISGDASDDPSSGQEGGRGRKDTSWKAQRVGLGAVHEVTVLQDASFRSVRSLNGDQTHQGRHVRISVGDWKTLHIRLYRYH
ncbi:MAG: DUF5597 domain-containing protein [Bacteroidales bacterium]|nr:DUF5597 domain-containing protein [Bacteroidales bacterium]